jgi:Arc/MetJ-type ribon-helix-helix transcriptional regulator
MKVNIDIPEDMLEAVDTEAKKGFFSRSEWIRTAIRSLLFTPPEGIHDATNLDSKEVDVYEGTYGSTNIPVASTTKTKGFCDCEKGVEYELTLITWEDENGTPIINRKFACPKCVEKYENMGRGRVFYL